MFGLFEIPLEIQEEIFNKCEAKDVQNLACCSSHCNELLKKRLWSSLVIPWKCLLPFNWRHIDPLNQELPVWRHKNEKKELENLKFTKYIAFDDSGIRLHKHNPQELVENFQKLITHCDPAAVQALCMHAQARSATYANSLCGRQAQVEGCIEYACKLLTGLREVDFSEVKNLSDDVFTSLSKLTASLIELNLNHTNTEDGHLILIAKNVKGLKKLKLDCCGYLTQRSVTVCVKNFINLKELTLKGLHFVNDTLLSLINNHLLLLENLDISCTDITNEGMVGIGNLKHLKYLVASCLGLGDMSMTYIASLSKLQSLEISSLRSITDQGLCSLSSLVRLKRLDISSCVAITDTAMSHVKKLVSLEELKINYNYISDVGLGHLVSLQKLKLLECDFTMDMTVAALQPFTERMKVRAIPMISTT